MVVYCCAYGCNNERGSRKNIRFHKFPLCRPEINNLWIKAVRRENFNPTVHTVICSDHFSPDSYLESSANKTLLKKDAVPSMFNFPHYLKPKSTAARGIRRKYVYEAATSCRGHGMNTSNNCDDLQNVRIQSFRDVAVQTCSRLVKKSQPEMKLMARKIKTLQQKVSRKNKKLKTMKDLINHLKKNNKSNNSLEETLINNFEGLSLELLQSELKNSQSHKTQRRYTTQIKEFSLTLYFYSPKAYNFIRKSLCLPHPATLRKWLSSHNCEVGFLDEVFQFLKKQVTHCNYLNEVALIFDAMAIRSQIVYDKKHDKHCGYVDLGGVASIDNQELATEVLVFQIVSYSTNFKCPIAYFFINKITSTLQKQFIELALQKLREINILVQSVTCDGCITNVKTFQLLGCRLDPLDEIQPTFKCSSSTQQENSLNTTDDADVVFILDPCHIIKLLRNALAEVNDFNSPRGKIDFKYIKKLHDLQESEDLKFANALSGAHINFHSKKMNVRLAVQVISSSVASAIDFLRASGHKEFQGSEATVEFIQIFDRIFDIMNSRSPFAKGYKSPLTLENYNYWKQIFVETTNYIKSLKVGNCSILQHPRKTFALGFLINIVSFEKLALRLLNKESNPLKYFLTYKCSQDHLELYFSCIRSRGGWNNNPNVLQFKWALRKLLFRNSVEPSVNGNCLFNNDFDVTPVFDFEEPKRNIIEQHEDQNHTIELDKELDQLALLVDYTSLSSIQENILYYIGGVIVRKIINKNPCTYCHEMIMVQCENDHAYVVNINNYQSFTKFISNGKLYYPSNAIFDIVQCAEKAFRAEINLGLMGKYNFKKRIVMLVVQYFIHKIKTMFNPAHPVVDISQNLHELQILKFVASTYAELRIQTHAKKKRLQLLGKKATLRHKLNKTILFYHI